MPAWYPYGFINHPSISTLPTDLYVKRSASLNATSLVSLSLKLVSRRSFLPSASATYSSVGFVMLEDESLRSPVPENPKIGVWRLMIDASLQRRGLGRMAMGYVVEEARRLGLTKIGLSHVDEPGHAGPFYESLGYRYTGEVDDGELKMELNLEALK